MPADPNPLSDPVDQSPSSEPATAKPSPVSPDALKGYAILGCYLTGIVGILVGIFAASGTALLAAAVAFGVVFHRSVD